MKKNLTVKEAVLVGSMLFGLFFGAGNLIFPVHMGQLAGWNVFRAAIGFIITGVGIPLLGVSAMGISNSSGLQDMSAKVGKAYSYFFTCALYLTIGPFFAIPRCATTSFTVGISALFPNVNEKTALFVFSLIFFAAALIVSLKPNKILTFVGKIFNPLFLVFFLTLVTVALIKPGAAVSNVLPSESYFNNSFSNGLLEGYNTMDALASLAFGIIVINVIKDLGIKEKNNIAKSTVVSGIICCIAMGLIYLLASVVGSQSCGFTVKSANGGIALADIAHHYFGKAGSWILAITVTSACLKTSIGLITSCAQTFNEMFPKAFGNEKKKSYIIWTCMFALIAFIFSNFGLNTIISYSIPVLMFLYPLSITLILLSLFGSFFNFSKKIYIPVTVCTMFAALFDMFNALPENIKPVKIVELAQNYLPLFKYGFGWVVPAVIGLIAGIAIYASDKK